MRGRPNDKLGITFGPLAQQIDQIMQHMAENVRISMRLLHTNAYAEHFFGTFHLFIEMKCTAIFKLDDIIKFCDITKPNFTFSARKTLLSFLFYLKSWTVAGESRTRPFCYVLLSELRRFLHSRFRVCLHFSCDYKAI